MSIYQPGKPISQVQREFGLDEVVKLASNENPLGPSPLAVAAMQEALKETRLYPENDCPQLIEALGKHLGMPEDHLIVGRGSDEVIHLIGLAFLNPREEVVMADPAFALHESTAIVMDADPVQVPLKNYTHNLQAMQEAITPKTKLVFITNPHNPTGTIVTKREVDRFMEGLPDGILVAFDEAYREYVISEEFPDSLEFVRQGRNVVVLRTFSKIYALAGLRVGYGIAPPHIMQHLWRVRQPFNVSSVAQAAATASLSDEDQVARSRRVNEEGKRYLEREFARLGLNYAPTEANFIFVDLQRDSVVAFRQLLKEGVIVRTGDIFGFPTHIRVTVGTREENEKFISALEKVLSGSA
jgi:histidinol-phosphate aminotransferase